jgi:inhibitor of cysteine peptidase
VYQQPGEKITVVTGKRFAVDLAANPTTGYSWQLSADPGGAVRLVDQDYTATGPQQPGSGGMQRFTFEGAAAGSASLEFAYVRPWEKGAAPAQTAAFPVTVT